MQHWIYALSVFLFTACDNAPTPPQLQPATASDASDSRADARRNAASKDTCLNQGVAPKTLSLNEDKESESDGESESTSSSDCSSTEMPSSLLKPPKMEECHKENKVYDRQVNQHLPLASQTCTSITLDMSWCNTEGIVEKFGASGTAARQRLNELKGTGWSEDQCGMDQSLPVVFLIKGDPSGDIPKLEIFRLSPAR
jgi:hypothetical protein